MLYVFGLCLTIVKTVIYMFKTKYQVLCHFKVCGMLFVKLMIYNCGGVGVGV